MISKSNLIWLIKEYSFDSFVPDYTFINRKSGIFRKNSFINTAAEELICYILNNHGYSPVIMVGEFHDQMLYFSRLKGERDSFFEVAAAFSNNILDVCRSAGWK